MTKDKNQKGKYIYFIDPEKKICKVEFSGIIISEQLADSMNKVFSDPAFSNDTMILIDGRGTSLNLNYNEVMYIRDTLLSKVKKHHAKIAVITTEKIAPVVQLISVFIEISGIKIKSFISIEKAVKWLDINNS